MTWNDDLAWPVGFGKENGSGGTGAFKVDLDQAEREMARTLEALGATSAYLSSDNPLGANGRPKGMFGKYEHSAVVLHFVRQGKELTIPCDKFDSLRANVRALGLSVAAIYLMDRYGTSQLMDAALSGFAALPAGGMATPPPKPWYDVFGIPESAPAELVEAAYKVALKRSHPDKGGSEQEFQQVQRAWESYQGARQ